MELRAAAAEATRERILDAAADAFLEHWYDDVTIASVAKRAGVSGQTVINHFGGKEQLVTAAHDALGRGDGRAPLPPEPGDVRGAVEALVEDYEITGDAVVRLLALEEKVPSLAAAARARPRGPPRVGRGHVPAPRSSRPSWWSQPTSTPGSCSAATRGSAATRRSRRS